MTDNLITRHEPLSCGTDSDESIKPRLVQATNDLAQQFYEIVPKTTGECQFK